MNIEQKCNRVILNQTALSFSLHVGGNGCIYICSRRAWHLLCAWFSVTIVFCTDYYISHFHQMPTNHPVTTFILVPWVVVNLTSSRCENFDCRTACKRHIQSGAYNHMQLAVAQNCIPYLIDWAAIISAPSLSKILKYFSCAEITPNMYGWINSFARFYRLKALFHSGQNTQQTRDFSLQPSAQWDQILVSRSVCDLEQMLHVPLSLCCMA